MSEDNSGPAFPVIHTIDGNWVKDPLPQFSGMTLRDWFAGQALSGWIANSPKIEGDRLNATLEHALKLSYAAYTYADAMLEARKK